MTKQADSQTMQALPNDHPMMEAWNEFCSTDEFKSALRWAVETKYDDGRMIVDIQREQHAKGSMWLAFTKGMELDAQRADKLQTELDKTLNLHADVIMDNVEQRKEIGQLQVEVKRLRKDNLAHCSALATTEIWMDMEQQLADQRAEIAKLKLDMEHFEAAVDKVADQRTVIDGLVVALNALQTRLDGLKNMTILSLVKHEVEEELAQANAAIASVPKLNSGKPFQVEPEQYEMGDSLRGATHAAATGGRMNAALRDWIDDNGLDDGAIRVLRAFFDESWDKASKKCTHHVVVRDTEPCFTCLGQTFTKLKRKLLEGK